MMVISLTVDTVEYQAITWQGHYSPGALVDNTFNATKHRERSAAITGHFYIEEQSTIAIPCVEGCGDLLRFTDFHNHSWMELELLRRRFL